MNLENSVLKLAEKIGSDLKGAYGYFPVWAEKSSSLVSNSFEWSFGSGGTIISLMGTPLVIEAELIGLSLSLRGKKTCTVEAVKNGKLTARRVSTNKSFKSAIEFTDKPIVFKPADALNFKTIKGAYASGGGVVCAWFRYKLF